MQTALADGTEILSAKLFSVGPTVKDFEEARGRAAVRFDRSKDRGNGRTAEAVRTGDEPKRNQGRRLFAGTPVALNVSTVPIVGFIKIWQGIPAIEAACSVQTLRHADVLFPEIRRIGGPVVVAVGGTGSETGPLLPCHTEKSGFSRSDTTVSVEAQEDSPLARAGERWRAKPAG